MTKSWGGGGHGKAGRCPEGMLHDPLVLGNAETLQSEQELGAAK